MRARPISKLIVALAAMMALFALSAAPASAAGPFPFSITGGTLTAAGNSFPLGGGPPVGAPCADKPDSTTMSTSGNAASGTWTMAGTTSTQFQLGTPPSGQWYQADITLNGSGTYSTNPTPPPPYLLAGTIIFQARIYRIPSCAKTDLACIITGRIAGNGTYTGTLPNAVTGDTFTFNGSTSNPGGLAMTATQCSLPFSSWHGQAASLAITGLIL